MTFEQFWAHYADECYWSKGHAQMVARRAWEAGYKISAYVVQEVGTALGCPPGIDFILDYAKRVAKYPPRTAMQCSWPACERRVTAEQIADVSRYVHATWEVADGDMNVVLGEAIQHLVNVSREGEAGSRSATKPNANLAGPEGDARPKCIHCYGDLMPNCIYCGGVGHKPEDCATPCDYYPTEHDPKTCRCPVGCNAPKGVGP